MSCFYCEFCGILHEDTSYGYVAGCVHYPPDAPNTSTFYTCSTCGAINATVTPWDGVFICDVCYTSWLDGIE